MKLTPYKLGDFCQMKYGRMPPKDVLSDEGFPVFSGYRITGYAKECLFDEPKIIVVARGVGGTGDVKMSPEKSWITNLCIVLDHDSRIVDKKFLLYRLGLEPLKDKLNTGAAQAQITIDSLKPYVLPLPELPEQQRIASILSGYDDLIENNRRRIQLLEQTARLLYEEWFVHLRFPGHEHVTITDDVPEGWEKKAYSDLFELLGGFAFKSKTYQAEGKYGIVTIKNVHDARFIPECPSRLDDAPEKMKEYCVLKTGDVLLSLTGNVGRICIVYGENYLLNQRVAKIVGKPGIPRSFVYWTFSNETTQKELENLAYGVAQLNLSPVKLGRREFVKPASTLLGLFAEIGEPIFEQVCTLNLQVNELTKARDLLLPRLMNGEVAI